MGTKKKGPSELELYQQAQAAQTRANAAAEAAAKPDPLEQRQRDYALSLDKWRMGESGPIDVRNMPGSGVGMSLFSEAKRSRDAGRIGRGLASLSDGANPNFAASLDKEMQLERDTRASGILEGYVDDTLGALDNKMTGLASMGNARSMGLAGLFNSMADSAYGRYSDYRKSKRPSFFKQLLMGFAGNANSAAEALAV
jgi:hypothetical protein